MCTYLNKTGSTHYFRRPVPDDLLGQFMTERGNSRSEWKRSLGTKDREVAKRLLRPHEIETDHLIDEARDAERRSKTCACEQVAARSAASASLPPTPLRRNSADASSKVISRTGRLHWLWR